MLASRGDTGSGSGSGEEGRRLSFPLEGWEGQRLVLEPVILGVMGARAGRSCPNRMKMIEVGLSIVTDS